MIWAYLTKIEMTWPSYQKQKREGLPKKNSCSFGFCPNEGGRGGPCPNFSYAFHKLYILGQFGDGEGGGDPCPIFWHIGVQKKWYKLSKLGGGGGGGGAGNLDKIQKSSYFFFGKPSLIWAMDSRCPETWSVHTFIWSCPVTRGAHPDLHLFKIHVNTLLVCATAVRRHCTYWYEIWALTDHEIFYIKIGPNENFQMARSRQRKRFWGRSNP